MIYLLDTSICIYLIRKKPGALIARFERQDAGTVGLSTITIAELQHGVEKSQYRVRNHAALEQFLLPLIIVEFDHAAALAYGRIRAELERRGEAIGAMDLLIAAHAVSLGVTVITNNRKEFERVPDLMVEDWSAPEPG